MSDEKLSETELSPPRRSAVKGVIQTTALSQTVQSLKAGFYGQAFVDDKPHSL